MLLRAIVFVVLCLACSGGAAFAQPWGDACNDGRIDRLVEDFDTAAGFALFRAHPTIPDAVLSSVPGCRGQALGIQYDLTSVSPDGQSWVVVQRSFPVINIASYTHIRVALRGSNLNSHDNVEVKLFDGRQLFTVGLRSMTDLPAWRPIYIDLRELAATGTIDSSNISRFEIGIIRCSSDCEIGDNPGTPQPAAEHTGTLYIDEFSFVDLKPGARNRLVETGFETATPNIPSASSAAGALAARVRTSGAAAGLIPAWFPEPSPNFNTYVQAEALLVFTYAYERTGSVMYRDLARELVAKLLALQVSPGRVNAGAWFTAYDANLRPPQRALTPGMQCDGNETSANDIDACSWIGNVGWALIALGRAQRSAFYDAPTVLADAIARGSQWLVGQIGRDAAYPGVISLGIEGNISVFFGLLASGRTDDAARLADRIYQYAWDPILQRMKTGVNDYTTALDVTGSWGVTFLRAIGRTADALAAQGYAATVMRTTSFDGLVQGYGDLAGPFTPALEFTAQAAVAGIRDTNLVLTHAYALQNVDGTFPGARDHWFGGQLPPWVATMTGVSPMVWMIFAAAGIDPLWDIVTTLPPGAPADLSASVNGRTVTLTWSVPAGAVTGFVLEAWWRRSRVMSRRS